MDGGREIETERVSMEGGVNGWMDRRKDTASAIGGKSLGDHMLQGAGHRTNLWCDVLGDSIECFALLAVGVGGTISGGTSQEAVQSPHQKLHDTSPP